jgi:hypothetical protein
MFVCLVNNYLGAHLKDSTKPADWDRLAFLHLQCDDAESSEGISNIHTCGKDSVNLYLPNSRHLFAAVDELHR